MATLAVTLLNPHVYLDTVVVVGGVAGTFTSDEKGFFLIGALLASFVWFFSLGYGARLLAPLFKKPSTWRIFDFIIGCVMFFISIGLIRYVLQSGS
jgi:L-lysine exporter family protein LysE/ArgO